MKKRLSIALTMIIIGSIVTCGIFTTIIFRQSYFSEAELNLKKSIDYINQYLLADCIQTNNFSKLDEYAGSTSLRLTITNKESDVIYESLKGLNPIENHQNRPEIKEAYEEKMSTTIRYSSTFQDEMIYVAAPYYQENDLSGVLRVAMPVNNLENALFQMINNLIFVVLITLLATIVLVNYFITKEMRPLEEASEFARKIASGKYHQRLTMIREDKIGELVESLNQMTVQLETSFTDLSQKNTELTSILSSMNHGVIAVNGNNGIIHINDAAKKVFKLSEQQKVIGKNILEIYRGDFIYELMLNLENESTEKTSFEYCINKNQFLRVHVNKIIKNNKINNGHIIVLEDISILKSLEKMRRDFIANVSHELKTPITTIKGFIETIQVNQIKDEKTLNRFYGIISEESDRLSRLVEDILILSQLENKGSFEETEVEIIEIENEILQILDLLKMTAQEKNIELELINDLAIKIKFSPDEFRQMMINLIDNGIKYSEKNKKIKIEIQDQGDSCCIQVIDQGYGIPEKDIPRIFERFYRVDKSRSKEKGGTGLGLAIVKHILQNNQGRIEVISEIGKGTTFKLWLPQKKDAV